MALIKYIRDNLTHLPFPFGNLIAKIPYSYRPGLSALYRSRQKEISLLDEAPSQEKKDYIFTKVKNIASHAYNNVPFYQELYTSCDINPNRLSCFEDIKMLPLINKEMLQSVPIEFRSCYRRNRYIVNTGGSSGKTLDFYIEPTSIPHEWAHMHSIWAKLDFSSSDLRIVFAGRSDIKDVLLYDSARHQVNVNIYAGWEVIAERLNECFSYFKPVYLHGYPSAIFDFVLWLEQHKHPLLPILRANIKGMFLGSEFPSPLLRVKVESLLDCGSVSWYGHTERALLAFEKHTNGIYIPFITYGYAESVTVEHGSSLVSTSYHNFSSPLVRYDTGDMILPNVVDDVLESFEITEGRSGEFILDVNNNKIYLTALIFGRHHSCFDVCTNVQVRQLIPGEAIIYYILRDKNSYFSPEHLASMFDSENVNVSFSFEVVEEPFRTSIGKVPLLVRV